MWSRPVPLTSSAHGFAVLRLFVSLALHRELHAVLGDRMHNLSGEVDLLFVRHGQSLDNVFPRQGPLGWTDPALSSVGMRQAVEASHNIRFSTRPDVVLCSSLLRAEMTALLVFPNQSAIYVAPYISETNWGSCLLHPASCVSPRAEQRSSLKQLLGGDSDRLSFAWAPPQNETGPPDWQHFLRWILTTDGTRDRIMSRLKSNARPCIAIASHGNYLTDLLSTHGWQNGHLRNVEVISAIMPIHANASGAFFTDMHITGTVFPGFTVPYWQAPKVVWTCLAVGFLLFAWFAWRRRGRQPESDPDYIYFRE